MVKAAVSVVFPWSTWPIVPMLTWGFLRSNLPRAARTVNRRGWVVEGVVVGEWRKRVEGVGVKEEERTSFEEFEGNTAAVLLLLLEEEGE